MSDWKDKPFFSDEEINEYFNMGDEGRRQEASEEKEKPDIKVNRVQFEELEENAVSKGAGLSLDLLLDLPIEVTVRLGSVIMPIGDLINLKEGDIISLEKLAGDRAEILVGEELLARGDVVVTIDKYSVVVKEVVQPREKIESSIYRNLKSSGMEN